MCNTYFYGGRGRPAWRPDGVWGTWAGWRWSVAGGQGGPRPRATSRSHTPGLGEPSPRPRVPWGPGAAAVTLHHYLSSAHSHCYCSCIVLPIPGLPRWRPSGWEGSRRTCTCPSVPLCRSLGRRGRRTSLPRGPPPACRYTSSRSSGCDGPLAPCPSGGSCWSPCPRPPLGDGGAVTGWSHAAAAAAGGARCPGSGEASPPPRAGSAHRIRSRPPAGHLPTDNFP